MMKHLTKIISLLLIGVFAVTMLAGCSGKTENETTTEVATDPGSVFVKEILPYSGQYVEDGSDDKVENIVAAVLVNTTASDWQYIEFSVTTNKGTHAFVASTVKAGSVTTVLCKDKDAFAESEKMESFNIDAQAEYLTPIDMAEGVLEIYYTDGTVTVKNASDKDLSDLCFYYKQRNATGYLGGITYCSKVASLKAGEFTQLNSAHLDEIVNITYHE